MFDIFPKVGTNKKKQDDQLLEHISSIKVFVKKALSDYPDERNGLLQAIGRLNSFPLKDLIYARLDIIRSSLPTSEIENINNIIKYGVKIRNYYVHGTEVKGITDNYIFRYLSLFTHCFEYIYILSDLLECGWDPEEDANLFSQHQLGSMKRAIELNGRDFIALMT